MDTKCSKKPSFSATSKATPSSALELIQYFHPGKLRLGISSLAKILDCAEQSIRNGVADGTFQIKSYKDGGKRYFDVFDIAGHLDNLRQAEPKRRRGRPTKVEALARAAALDSGKGDGGLLQFDGEVA